MWAESCVLTDNKRSLERYAVEGQHLAVGSERVKCAKRHGERRKAKAYTGVRLDSLHYHDRHVSSLWSCFTNPHFHKL
jgi:hypothetical protein